MNSLPPSFQTAANDGFTGALLNRTALEARLSDISDPNQTAANLANGLSSISGAYIMSTPVANNIKIGPAPQAESTLDA